MHTKVLRFIKGSLNLEISLMNIRTTVFVLLCFVSLKEFGDALIF